MRTKGIKQKEVRELPNVFSGRTENLSCKLGKFWGNKNPLTVEIGCGTGDYTLNLSKMYPQRNFVGFDVKGSRIWTGAKKALSENITNAVFVIAYAEKTLHLLSDWQISDVWIPFPHPYPRPNSIKKRIVHPRFLQIYKNILAREGRIHLKTDDTSMYEYALKVLKEEGLVLFKSSADLYGDKSLTAEEQILTKYELDHLKERKVIKYLCFGFADSNNQYSLI